MTCDDFRRGSERRRHWPTASETLQFKAHWDYCEACQEWMRAAAKARYEQLTTKQKEAIAPLTKRLVAEVGTAIREDPEIAAQEGGRKHA